MNFKNGIKKIGAGLALSAMLLTSVVPINSFAADTQPVYTINIKAANNKTDGAEYSVLRTKKMLETGELVAEKTPVQVQKVTLTNGSAQVKVNEKGVYQLKPVKRAKGYLLDQKEDGKSAQVSFPLVSNGSISANQVFEFQTKNRPLVKDVEFIKYGNDKKTPLANVTFELRQTHSPKTIDSSNKVSEWQQIDKATQDKNKKVYTTKEDGKLVYTNLSEGKYELVETATANGYELNQNKNTFTVTQNNNIATIEASTITGSNLLVNYLSPVPEKSVVQTEGEAKTTTVNVDIPYVYDLKFKAPADIKDYVILKMIDNLDSRLEVLGVTSITQTDNKNLDITDKAELDKLVKIEGNNVTVDLKSQIAKLVPEKEVHVYLKTKIKSTTVTKTPIKNSYDIVYNNGKLGDPTVEKKKTSKDDDSTITTPQFGSIKFTKTKSDGKTPLEGATFRIFRLGSDKIFTPIKPGDKTEITVNYQKVNSLKEALDTKAYVNPTTGKEIPDVVSGKDGVVEFKNLPYGQYVIYEVKAPANYNVKQDGLNVDVNAKTEEVVLENVKNYSTEENVPGTGTKGAMIFAIVGAGLVAGSIYVARRKKALAK